MNIADVKRELTNDEKVLESAFKLETLYKKYKVIIWAIVIGLILFFVGREIMQSMHKAKLEEANSAYLALQNNATDTAALATLKEKNPTLFELFTYAQANKNQNTKILSSLAKSANDIVADGSTYAVAVLDKKPVDSVLYKDMAIVEEAYVALKSGDTESAKSKLSLIDERSPLYTVASLLKHSTLKVK